MRCVLTFKGKKTNKKQKPSGRQTEVNRVWVLWREIAVFVCTCASKGTGDRRFVGERQYQMAVSSQEGDGSSAIYSNHLLIVLQL